MTEKLTTFECRNQPTNEVGKIYQYTGPGKARFRVWDGHTWRKFISEASATKFRESLMGESHGNLRA